MFQLKREDITIDRSLGIPSTRLSVKLCDPNGMVLKAKAEFVANTLEACLKIFEAKEEEYATLYGDEVIKNTHHNIAFTTEDQPSVTHSKTVYSKEVQQKLLDKAFKE